MGKLIAGTGLAILLLPLAIAVAAVVSLIVAWPVMLLIGNAAIASGGVVPSLGYWTTFWLTWALTIVTARSSSN